MKKFVTILSVLGICLLTLSFASCMDEDDRDAYNLSGSWHGDFAMEYDGYPASYSDVTFIPDYDYATHGTGYQRDYYPYLGGYINYELDWNIRNGVLYISYYDDLGYIAELDTEIYNYGLDYYNFWGYIGNNAYFSLGKTGDWYYDYYTRSDAKASGAKNDSIITNYDRTKLRNAYMKTK